MHYRLLALDVDGTLLDPSGELRPIVRDTVLTVQQRGLRVVLCTGPALPHGPPAGAGVTARRSAGGA